MYHFSSSCTSLNRGASHSKINSYFPLKKSKTIFSLGNSLVVQWFGLHAFTAEGPGSNHSWGTKIAQAAQPAKKKKKV